MGVYRMVEERKKFIINFLYFIILGGIVYFILTRLLGYIMPFFIGFLIVFMLKPLTRKFSQLFKISYKFASVLTLLLFYILILLLITLSGRGIFLGVRSLLTDLPNTYRTYIEPLIITASDTVEGWLENINPAVIDELSNYTDTIIAYLQSLATTISSGAVKGVSGVPSFLLSTLITIVSSFFIASDYYSITRFIIRQFPEKIQLIIIETKDYMVTTGFNIVKAYAILMSVTFIELVIGLSILRIDNVITLSLLIAIFDILPFFGVGGILLPWAALEFLNNNIQLAIGFLVVYIVITVIRQSLESRVVGHQIGLHPIVTLVSMYVGIKIFGGIGIIVFPMIVITIKHLNDEGRIQIFK